MIDLVVMVAIGLVLVSLSIATIIYRDSKTNNYE